MSNSILIKDVRLLGAAADSHVDILVEGGVITGITATGEDPTGQEPTVETVIAGNGRLALPGLVNAHNHIGMTILRSYSDDLPLWQWLREKMWPVEDRLTEEDVYIASLVAIAEMLRGGTTTFADMYFHMQGVAKAVEESGIRAVLSRGLQGLSGTGTAGLREAEALVTEYGGHDRITVMLGPHSPVTCPPEFLREVVKLSERLEVPIQTHLAETQTEVEEIARDYQLTPLEYLDKWGVLDRGLMAIHSVHLSPSDIALMQEYEVTVVHCPTSNLKLGSGIAPVPQLQAAGITVGLGTDGPASNNDLDMWEEMRLAALIHKGVNLDPLLVPAETAWQMATVDSARALGLTDIGELKVGCKADVILVDIQQPHWTPQLDLTGNLVYSGKAADVSLVMVNGQVVLEDGEVLLFDETEAMSRLQRRAEELGLTKG